MKASNFRKMKNQPYTRREYIDGIPGSKVVKFTMGSPGKEFNTTLRLISLKAGQIRHNALEAARMAANRYLELNLGLENYVLKIVPYPHHILREKKRLNVAQADRFQEGMKLAYGSPVGVAARVKRRKNIVRARADADIVGEHVKIEMADDMLKMSAVGDIGSAFSEWERGADELLELKVEEDSGATFTLSYLRDITNTAGVTSEVATLELATEMPIRMDFELPQGKLVYYIAPCIGV